jgi:hypothetical protein
LGDAHLAGVRRAVFPWAPVVSCVAAAESGVAPTHAIDLLASAGTASANLTAILRRLNELMEAELALGQRAGLGQAAATRDWAVSDKAQED